MCIRYVPLELQPRDARRLLLFGAVHGAELALVEIADDAPVGATVYQANLVLVRIVFACLQYYDASSEWRTSA